MDKAALRIHRPLNENFRPKGDTSLQVTGQRVPYSSPQIIQTIATAVGCPSELDNKTLLLDITHTSLNKQKNQAETGIETSFLIASPHSAQDAM